MASRISRFEQAVQLHQQRRFEQALAAYRQVLQRHPDHVDALINLGSVLRSLGHLAEAIAHYQRALALNPERAEVWYNLGNALQANGQVEEAIAAFQRALQVQPTLSAACFNLGKLYQDRQAWETAAAYYQQALTHAPDLALAQMNLGNVLKAMGQREAALHHHQRSVQLQPNSAQAHYNLANTLRDQTQYPAAIAAYQRALQLQPSFAAAHLNLAGVLEAMDRPLQAIQSLRQAIEANPNLAEAHLSLGRLLHDQGDRAGAAIAFQTACQLQPENWVALDRWISLLQEQNQSETAIAYLQARLQAEPTNALLHCKLGSVHNDLKQFDHAIAHLRQAVLFDPTLAMAYNNLGYALNASNQMAEALEMFDRAIALNPNLTAAYINQGYTLTHQGRIVEALACYEQTVQIEPDNQAAQSNRLFLLNYQEAGMDAAEAVAIAQTHQQWGDQVTATLPPPTPWRNSRDPDRPLRVGYVSPDLRQHPVSYFIEPILTHHDATQVQAICYSNAIPDSVTERLSTLAHQWHTIHHWDEERLAEQVRSDQIDILVDLAGHTANNRLLLFARKPAPLQVTYLGYPNTTGLRQVDYRLTDAWADPPGLTDSGYSERLLRLPRCFLCYQPPATTPDVLDLPAQTIGRITFGSFNHLPKVTPAVVALWAQLLHALPTSRLILKSHVFEDASTRDRYFQLFAQHGISEQRLKLIGLIPDLQHHLAFYGNIDIALDPFPYNGTTTTCEALWMGVPVLTLAGTTHVSRVGASLLTAVGLPDLIATTPAEYLDRAIALANDWIALAALRTRLRQQVAQSSLCDAIAHTRALEAAYRQIWQQNWAVQ